MAKTKHKHRRRMTGWEIIYHQNFIRKQVNKDMPDAKPENRLKEYAKRIGEFFELQKTSTK